MGAIFKWTALLLAGIVISAIIQPPIERLLDKVGWMDGATFAAGAAMNWLETIVGESAFPWVAGSVLGIAFGAWADSALKRFDGRHPIGKRARARALSPNVSLMALRLQSYLGNPFMHHKEGASLWMDSFLVLEKIQALGIGAPSDISGPFSNERAQQLCIYFQIIAPLLREGRVKAAADLVESINKRQAA